MFAKSTSCLITTLVVMLLGANAHGPLVDCVRMIKEQAMKKLILAISAAILLTLGMASAQTTLPVVKAKAGQVTYVEIAQLYDNGAMGTEVKLMWVGSDDSNFGNFGNEFGEHFQALDEGIPRGWNVFVSSSERMKERVAQPGFVQTKIYNNYACSTYGLSIPQGTVAGQYGLTIHVRDLNTGQVAEIPLTVEVL